MYLVCGPANICCRKQFEVGGIWHLGRYIVLVSIGISYCFHRSGAVQIWDGSGSVSRKLSRFRLRIRLRAKCPGGSGSGSGSEQSVPVPAAPAPHPCYIAVQKWFTSSVPLCAVFVAKPTSVEHSSTYNRSGRHWYFLINVLHRHPGIVYQKCPRSVPCS